MRKEVFEKTSALILISLRGVCLGGSRRISEHKCARNEAFSRNMHLFRNFEMPEAYEEKFFLSQVLGSLMSRNPIKTEIIGRKKLLCHPQQYVRLQAEEIKLEYSNNVVTNSRVTPSWREIVSLAFSEAGVLHVNWTSLGHCVSRRGHLCKLGIV
ncbi:hypothetical protein Tco_1189300 [Tanacetum coccineum]